MRKKPDEEFDVFLSHNSEDKAVVRTLAERLTQDGFKVWIDQSELYGGDTLPVTLKNALTNSAACAVFLGKNGVGPWQQKEIDIVTKLKYPKRRVIPVFLPDGGNELPPELSNLLWIRFSSLDDTPKYQQLVGAIRERKRDRARWDRIRKSLIVAGV